MFSMSSFGIKLVYMKSKFWLLLIFELIGSVLLGQDNALPLKGKVSFVTSNNVYVKFNNTSNINVGDTLQLANNQAPCLIVQNKSTTSCVCTIINNSSLKVGDEISHRTKKEEIKPDNRQVKKNNKVSKKTDEPIIEKNTKTKNKEYIHGKISASSYSNISSVRDDRHRIMSRFSLNADNIRDSKFSFETYLNYQQNFTTGESSIPQRGNNFKVYNLALRFDADSSLSFTLGRKINNKISSVGAIDGLQAEKYLGDNYIGLIAGFRPDIFDYNFNSNLFEYGAYFGRKFNYMNFFSQTTVGFLEQRNRTEVDRRFLYFQHSSTIFKKLNVFSSVELDIYNKINGTSNNDARLTNAYISARYRFNRKFDITLSYDSRKRVIYYRSFETEIEQLLNDDIARQGVRAQINYRPIKTLYCGVSYSRRFQANDLNNSENYYAYASLSHIPTLGGSLSAAYNKNTSNYLGSNMFSVRHSRTLIDNKLYSEFYYRNVKYSFSNNDIASAQNYYGADFSYNITRKLLLSISGEMSDFNGENNYRIYTKIVKRFDSKRK